MMNFIDQIGEKFLTWVSIGSYTGAKVLGFATADLTLTWHFQALQELAFAAAIGSFFLAVYSWHKNFREKKKTTKHHARTTKKTDTKD